MFAQIFFVFIGLFLIYTGLTSAEALSVVLGVAALGIALERLYYLKTGRQQFGLRDNS